MGDMKRVLIIGAGMSGILAGLKLKQRGNVDFIIYEKADAVSGTWKYNRYPGLACDVPAHAYTFSFEPNPDWSEVYASGQEIRAYFEGIVERYGLTPYIRLNSEVTSCEWADGRWRVTLADGLVDHGDVVIAASGVLHHPNIPAIPGLERFEGDAFHSTVWNDAAKLDGARVGVIGCGSTGVQIVSALAGRARSLVHFCRTPQWIMPICQRAYSEEEKASFRADPNLIDAIRYGDKYQGVLRRFETAITDPESPEMAEIEQIVRENLETSVQDEALREKLRPAYRAACKRLIFSGDYYEAVQQPRVTVETGGIEAVEPCGVRMRDGSFYELDTLVLATGFAVDRFIRPTRVTGENGLSLDEVWADRPSAYRAVCVPGFPNFFMLNGPTGPVGNFSLIDVAETQWRYIEQLLELLLNGNAKAVAVTRAAAESYEQWRAAEARKTVFATGCASWYLDNRGVPNTWPKGLPEFRKSMANPDMQEFALSA